MERDLRPATRDGGTEGRVSAAALRLAAVGVGLPCALHRILARTQQPVLGGYLRGDRLSAAPRRVVAQGLVPIDRHSRRRRSERVADGLLPTRSRPVPRRSGIVGGGLRLRGHAVAQLRVLFGGAGRGYGSDRLP